MTLHRWERAALGLALAIAGAGCVSRDAGIGAARSEVQHRTGLDVRWRADDQGDEAEMIQKLLAQPLTAESASKLALLSNADVQAALDDVGVARAALVSALQLPNPKAHLGLDFHGDGDPKLEAELTLNVAKLFFLPAREGAASAALDAASLDAAGAVLDVAFDAKVAFYEHQAASQRLELRKTLLYAAAQSADIASRLVEAGNVPELDALTERALYESARIALARAEAEESATRQRLNALLGLFGEAGERWTSASALPAPTPFDTARLESRALAANLELRALEKRHAAAAGRVDVAWADGLVPEIDAGIGVERDEGEWGIGPRLGFEVPIFYQGQGEVDAAEAEMRGAKHRHEAVAIRVRAIARSAAERVARASDEVSFLKDTLLPLQDRILDETLKQYNAMNAGPLQVLSAKRDQIEVSASHVDALRDYWIARAEAEALLAGRARAVTAAPRAPAMPSGRPTGGH